MPKIITVYVVRDTATGLYEAGEGYWKDRGKENARWVPRCTAESLDEATEMDDSEFAETFPDGLPAGWEKIKVMEFESKTR